MTVLEGIQKGADYLAKKDVESPRLQAELLLAHVLKLPRMQLYLRFDRALQSAEVDLLRDLIRRRGLREPLQHIIGSTSFCGFEIGVNRNVLVPRPETELLAEAGWKFLSSIESNPPEALDIGTGSGCIAIALAAKCPSARIHAVDVSAAAIATATGNARLNGVHDRITFVEGDRLTAMPAGLLFDLIISNPPYIAAGEIAGLQPEVREFDPRAALDGGADGLDFYRGIAVDAAGFLRKNGRVMVEFGDGQAESVKNIFEKQNWIVEEIMRDYTQRPRILIAQL